MATITVQVPDDLAAVLKPLDGKLKLDGHWLAVVVRDAVDLLCSEVQALDGSASGAELHSVAARLEQFADVLNEIEVKPRRLDAAIDALAVV